MWIVSASTFIEPPIHLKLTKMQKKWKSKNGLVVGWLESIQKKWKSQAFYGNTKLKQFCVHDT